MTELFWARSETYDSIKNDKFLTLEEQIEALAEYLPDWDRTLEGLANLAAKRGWELTVTWCSYFDQTADAVLIDYNGFRYDDEKDEMIPGQCWAKDWSRGGGFYATIRCFREAIGVPEYPQGVMI